MKYNKSITATVYIINEGKVLLHQHKKYKTWFPVGGHVETNEFPHEAAIREVKEESGLDVLLTSTENFGDINLGRVERMPLPFITCRCGDTEEFYDFIYIGTINGGEINPAKGESKEFHWFSRDEINHSDIKTHVKNTALSVLDYIESKGENK